MLYVIVFGVFIVFFILMSLGWVFARKKISGSCGGLNSANLNNKGECLSCGMKIDSKAIKKIKEKLE